MTSLATQVVIVSREAAFGEEIAQALRTHGVSDSPVLPDLSLVAAHLDAAPHPKAVIVDVDSCDATVWKQISSITRRFPAITLLVVTNALDITLVARAILCRVSDFIVRSAHPHDATSEIISACKGHPPKPDGAFQRIRTMIPGPRNSSGKCVTFLGEEISVYDAVTACDRLGLSAEDIADHLEIPLRAVEKVVHTKTAPELAEPKQTGRVQRKIPRPVVAAVSLLAVVLIAGTAFTRVASLSKRKPLQGIISGGSWTPTHMVLQPSTDDGRPTCSIDVIEGTFAFTRSNGPYPGPHVAVIRFSGQPTLGFTPPPQDSEDERKAAAGGPGKRQPPKATVTPLANPFTYNLEVPENSPYVITIRLPSE